MHAHFFITGGTGLVGKNLLPRLLLSFPGSTAMLLVRGEDDEDARNRVRSIAVELQTEYGIHDAPGRIQGVLGDVGLDHCGLARDTIEHLVRTTTHIIHGAATIRFDHPIDEARAINCGGTRRMLAIAHMCVEGGTLERFVYIGTSSVSGQRGGRIYEHELETGQRFFNTYEQSKMESERIVRDQFDRLPCTIFRPSIGGICGRPSRSHRRLRPCTPGPTRPAAASPVSPCWRWCLHCIKVLPSDGIGYEPRMTCRRSYKGRSLRMVYEWSKTPREPCVHNS